MADLYPHSRSATHWKPWRRRKAEHLYPLAGEQHTGNPGGEERRNNCTPYTVVTAKSVSREYMEVALFHSEP
jgi:hypothetical protein